ncbi:MAG: fibronectin type III domain-containing protein, partial [Verrucomicrobiae bacterium]|nr:fibronectin type III domain-containing protein [Verrucomicrobiae bacterium]
EIRGRLILIVEDSHATALATEIERLIADLTGDGWIVARSDVSSTASVTQVRTTIQTRYQEAPTASKVVFLLGHVPVPYSGIVCPDGHNDPPPQAHHQGAWPADVFYGDMDGTWTDTTVDHSLANVDGPRNFNIPGDGKFDQSLIVGDILPELAVGRVDFANMAGMANGLSETNLLRQYLNRDHEFRHRIGRFASLGERAMIDDNFGNAFEVAFGASGWASGIALVGNANTSAQEDWVATLRDQDHLIAYGSGPGSFQGAGGVSSSYDFRDTRSRSVFYLLFGSFFGDWDSTDNYLRAPLAGPADSNGLVSVWSGIPRWQLFPLAAGGTMADAYQHVIREVNLPGGPFPPDMESWTNPDQTHVAIMGDPTLRSHPVKPVTVQGVVVND